MDHPRHAAPARRPPRAAARLLAGTLAAALPAIQGCAQTRTLALGGPAHEAAVALGDVGRSSVEATLTDGRAVHLRDVRFSADSVVGTPRRSGDPSRLPLSGIRALRYRDPGKGGLRGILVGAVTGAALSLPWGLEDGDTELAAVGVAVGAGIGWVVGTLVGVRVTVRVLP